MDPGHLGSGESGRQGGHPSTAHGGDRLRRIDHTPAAERDQVGVLDVGEHPRRDLVDRPGWDVVKAGRALGKLERRSAHRALGRQQLVMVEAMLAQELGRLGDDPRAEVDRALAVAPGEI